MGAVRNSQYRVAVTDESAYADGGTFNGSAEKVMRPVGEVDLSSIDHEWIEDARTTPGGGSDEQIQGLAYKRIAVPLSTYAEGLGTAAGDGTQAVDTAVTRLLEMCLQSAADLTTGDALTGTPTTTSLVDTTAGEHDVSNSSIGLVLVEQDDGSYEWAPYTYSTATMSLLLALGAAPSAANIAYGAAVIPYVENWSGAIGVSKAIRFANDDGGADTDYDIFGCFGTFSIPNLAPDGVAQLDFSIQAAGFVDDTDRSLTGDSSSAGKVFAGADVKIGAYGETAYSTYCVESFGFNLNATYRWQPCVKQTGDTGVSGADRAEGVPEITMTFPVGSTPPAAITSSSSTFRASRRATGDEYHVMAALDNGGPGRSMCVYMPRAIIYDVQIWQLSDGRVIERVTFRPKTGLTEPQVIFAQA